MNQHEETRRKIVAEWLRKADADMNLAKHLLSERAPYTNAIAFHSQQAAEKYLKAFLTCYQINFPKTHDLEELLDLVETKEAGLAESLRDSIVLSPYGVELRYPGDSPDATAEEAQQAVELADKVHTAVLTILRSVMHNVGE